MNTIVQENDDNIPIVQENDDNTPIVQKNDNIKMIFDKTTTNVNDIEKHTETHNVKLFDNGRVLITIGSTNTFTHTCYQITESDILLDKTFVIPFSDLFVDKLLIVMTLIEHTFRLSSEKIDKFYIDFFENTNLK